MSKMNTQETQIQSALNSFLSARSTSNSPATGQHLDDDSLAAFTEGNLSEREARPIVSHLVDCSFCRHVTAELIRLDAAFEDVPETAAAAGSNEPSSVSDVLSGLLSRIFGTRDGAVFAHHETDEPAKEDSETAEQADPENKD